MLMAYQEKAGVARIGEKTPGHSAFIPTLLEWFPDARFLFTQRDPRAVIASQLKTWYVKKRLTPRSLRHGLFTGNREQELVFFANDWVDNFEQRFAPYADDPRFRKVIYEDLVRNPEAEMRSIFDFLEEDFEASIMDQRNDDTLPADQVQPAQMQAWRQEHIERSKAPISADSLDKWKSDLTAAEVAMIEGRCGDAMRAHGYEPTRSSNARLAGRAAAALIEVTDASGKQGRKLASVGRRGAGKVRNGIADVLLGIARASIARGLSPAWFAYKGIQRETVQEYFARQSGAEDAGVYDTVHPENRAQNALPVNVSSRDQLPDDQGWWGYSFWDVPERISHETFLATVPNCLITWYKDPAKKDDFYPAILNKDSRAFDMRELRFRPLHASTLFRSPKPARLKKATWFIERVYHNHSHWLTAHLPRLLLLREKGLLDQVILPPERTDAIDGSLRMLGLKPEEFQTYDPTRPLFVEELTILGTDRFRPELLQMVPAAFGVHDAPPPHRKVFISRLQAARRRLVNEDEIWPLLEPLGFERVFMEDLSFEDQVKLMRETAVLAAPHGAGLTNMIFCQKGTHIVEMADLSFPNPNFYALAAAMGHHYWLIPATSIGDVHPLEKDLRVDPAAVKKTFEQLERFSTDQATELSGASAVV
ncbi:hypothetical protein GCM10022278_33820 [Allohahella marinimesophila]|uniref:Glycosyltransferase 61 catalytic domain-containing protein n=1 Tax=Allohahella marinimesophila TaxID=1054972 RepID=A0ABP7PZH0_9GAMM